jgi:hypothetical protein
MRSHLPSTPSPLIGITSLAIGADQLFAEIVLELGGTIEVIVPFPDYALRFEQGHHQQKYYELLNKASRVNVLQMVGSDEEAYFAAGKKVVDEADMVLAVWNGLPAAGLGGTGDVVAYAIQQGKTVFHINPVKRVVIELP